MIAPRLPYRLQQVLRHSSRTDAPPKLTGENERLLTASMLQQFRMLTHADQRHLLRVAGRLRELGADEDTVTAGLIHDVGKACGACNISVIDRGLHVILGRAAGPLYRSFAEIETPPAFARELHLLANHPERGARAAQQAGYNDRVVYLVRYHESGGDSSDEQLQLLRMVDNERATV